jgi:ABC-type multidrug transport system fused ATPase/permease subunit
MPPAGVRFGAVVVAALLWWGGLEILEGTMTFGVPGGVHAVHAASSTCRSATASAKSSVMQAATVAAERVFALLDTPVETGGAARAGDRAHPGAGRGGRDDDRTRSPSGSRPRPPALEFRDVLVRVSRRGPGEQGGLGRCGRRDTGRGRSRGVVPEFDNGERVAVVGGTGAGRPRSPGS